MKRSEKQLPIKEDFRTFFPLNCFKFKLRHAKRLIVTKNLKAAKSEGVCGQLESKKKIHRERVTK